MENIELITKLKELNLEGHIFYNSLYGSNVTLVSINDDNTLTILWQNKESILLSCGEMYKGGECILWPSKEERNWTEYFNTQKVIQKTWETLVYKYSEAAIRKIADTHKSTENNIELAAQSLMRIIEIIDYFYNGNVTEAGQDKYVITISKLKNELSFNIKKVNNEYSYFGFKNADLANEFLSKESNKELIKTLYSCN